MRDLQATKVERIKLAIAAAELKAKRLRWVLRQLERIFAKNNPTEKDIQTYDECLVFIREYDLAIPDEYRHLCW